MTIQVQPRSLVPNKLGLIDVDIHTKPHSNAELKPFLSQHWFDHLNTYGFRHRHGFNKGHPYPKSQPANGARRDAFPPDGSMPGSDLAFMQKQHLDHYGIDFGIMNPLSPTGQGDQNPEFSAAMAAAANMWQIELFTRKDARLKSSVVVPYEDATASVAEIRKQLSCQRSGQEAREINNCDAAKQLLSRRHRRCYAACLTRHPCHDRLSQKCT